MLAAASSVLALVLCAAPAPGPEPCLRDCRGDASCIGDVTACLLDAGRPADAVAFLKPVLRLERDRPDVARALASAYLEDRNGFWAIRTLAQALQRDPADCQSRAWLAWVDIEMGLFDAARDVLRDGACVASDEQRARFLLLEALMLQLEERPQRAAEQLGRVPRRGLWPEDRELWLRLRQLVDPDQIEPLLLRADVGTGLSSNPLAGSPTDASSSQSQAAAGASALARADLAARFVLRTPTALAPALELRARGTGFLAEAAQGLSFVELGSRPGLVVIDGRTRLWLFYSPEILLLADTGRPGAIAKPLFSVAQRVELELERSSVSLFAGAGRRVYGDRAARTAGFVPDLVRSRFEFDLGAGGALVPLRNLQLLWAVSDRYHLADDSSYDLVGATALVVAHSEFDSGFAAQLGLTGAFDAYFNSGGAYGKYFFGVPWQRNDRMVKVAAEGWSPEVSGARLGLVLEVAAWDSSADNPLKNFDFVEQRVLLKLRWSLGFDPSVPEAGRQAPGLSMRYSLLRQDAAAAASGNRIRELLRQEQAEQRGGCGCGH